MFDFVQFIHPFTAIVAGPTGSGKTEFIIKFIANKNKLIQPNQNRIFYCYSLWQDRFNNLRKIDANIKFVNGLIDIENLDKAYKNLVILDDLMKEATEDIKILDLFTNGSHHINTSVVLLSQNLFSKGKYSRTLSLNSHYLVLFKNPSDLTQISFLSRQMYPKRSKFLEEAYQDATLLPHSYLLIDLKQSTPEQLRIQSNIFSVKEHVFYINKK